MHKTALPAILATLVCATAAAIESRIVADTTEPKATLTRLESWQGASMDLRVLVRQYGQAWTNGTNATLTMYYGTNLTATSMGTASTTNYSTADGSYLLRIGPFNGTARYQYLLSLAQGSQTNGLGSGVLDVAGTTFLGSGTSFLGRTSINTDLYTLTGSDVWARVSQISGASTDTVARATATAAAQTAGVALVTAQAAGNLAATAVQPADLAAYYPRANPSGYVGAATATVIAQAVANGYIQKTNSEPVYLAWIDANAYAGFRTNLLASAIPMLVFGSAGAEIGLTSWTGSDLTKVGWDGTPYTVHDDQTFLAGVNYLSPSGSGSGLTGITATQVGAVSTNDARYLAAVTNGQTNVTLAGTITATGGNVLTNGGPVAVLAAGALQRSGDTATGELKGLDGTTSNSFVTLRQLQEAASIYKTWQFWPASNSTVLAGAKAMRTIDEGAPPSGSWTNSIPSNNHYTVFCSKPLGTTSFKSGLWQVNVTMRRTSGGGDALSESVEFYTRGTNGVEVEITPVTGTQPQVLGATDLEYIYTLNVTNNQSTLATDSFLVKFKSSGRSGAPSLIISSGFVSVPIPSTQYPIEAPNDGNAYVRRNMAWVQVPGPGCTDLGGSTNLVLTGTTVNYTAAPTNAYAISMSGAPASCYSLNITSTNACTLTSGMSLQGSWTITGTNILTIVGCTNSGWRVYGRGI